ncbi:interleukin-3 [Erethizon dorsatum]
MCPAIPGASSFPTLLLVLLLFRPGLQAPTTGQHRSTMLCNGTIKELLQELEPSPADPNDTPDMEDRVLLCNNSLWRKNMCVFLSALKRFPNTTEKMKKNLEFLKEYVPEPHSPATKKYITIRNWDDFRRKLRYYLDRITCEGSKAPDPAIPLPPGVSSSPPTPTSLPDDLAASLQGSLPPD